MSDATFNSPKFRLNLLRVLFVLGATPIRQIDWNLIQIDLNLIQIVGTGFRFIEVGI